MNCRWAYVKEANPDEDLEFPDFPESLEMKAEARKYTGAFASAVQPVIINMNDVDEHVLRGMFSPLDTPPPPGTKYRVKSMPMSLAEIATPEWTKLVQDLASRMEALPRGFSITEQQMSSLLAKLE